MESAEDKHANYLKDIEITRLRASLNEKNQSIEQIKEEKEFMKIRYLYDRNCHLGEYHSIICIQIDKMEHRMYTMLTIMMIRLTGYKQKQRSWRNHYV